jgi:hypothetical protein
MCERELECLRKKQEVEGRRKIAIVCNYSNWCNGDKNCLKCPFLMELKVEDLEQLDAEQPVDVEEGCNCG